MDVVKKFLAKLMPDLRNRLEQAIDDICARRLSAYQVRRLTQTDHLYRVRIGRYRIVFYMDSTTVIIKKVDRRGDHTYRGL